jgi:hypothetical protein
VTPRPPVDYWLKLVDALINQRFAELLDEHGVTRREWEMLRLLTAGPATREVLDEALLPFLGPAPGTSTADQLAELVDSGWVARDEAGYILTSVGRQSFTRLDAAVQRVDSAITAGLAPEELATAVAVLQQMARNLGRSGALRPGAPTD